MELHPKKTTATEIFKIFQQGLAAYICQDIVNPLGPVSIDCSLVTCSLVTRHKDNGHSFC